MNGGEKQNTAFVYFYRFVQFFFIAWFFSAQEKKSGKDNIWANTKLSFHVSFFLIKKAPQTNVLLLWKIMTVRPVKFKHHLNKAVMLAYKWRKQNGGVPS